MVEVRARVRIRVSICDKMNLQGLCFQLVHIAEIRRDLEHCLSAEVRVRARFRDKARHGVSADLMVRVRARLRPRVSPISEGYGEHECRMDVWGSTKVGWRLR